MKTLFYHMIWVIFGVAKKFDMGGQKVRHETHVELFDFDEMKKKGMGGGKLLIWDLGV